MKEAVDDLFVEAVVTADEAARAGACKYALRMEKHAELKAAIQLARSEGGIPIGLEDLDADPWLLNVRNGTVDLRDGAIRPHRREDLLTHLCDIEFDPEASAPRWSQFLKEIIPDEEVRDFLRRAVGYSLTGDTREHVFFICHGSGANGKSVLFETLLALLGDLAIKCPSDTIARQRGTGIPNDVARLVGKRFAAAVELEEGMRLAESRVKEMVGGDTISARFMKAEWFDFRPRFKLWLASNYRPRVRGTDYGIWRRVCLIPFDVTVDKPDRDLLGKLLRELPGILAWALDGCREWQAGGLQIPARLQLATDEYRTSEDVIGRFIADECELDEPAVTAKSDLYEAFESWCADSGEDAPGKRKFGTRLKDMQLDELRTSNKRSWIGIRLRGPA